ncbi:MAG: glutamate-5-semialdehyde dehydrogenase [Eggerthellaceae bacterium]|nr:glutamate-5-semialdehyde dehydrogenase [Eggerthellaceae bacterium]
MSEAYAAATRAKQASSAMALTTEEMRNNALHAMADALRDNVDVICEANAKDMAYGEKTGVSKPILDRLYLDAERIENIARALDELAALDDPTGKILETRTLDNDLEITRVTVPMGVVAMIYEARPNVTADAAGICIKSGNACVLRGGSLAVNSNLAISDLLSMAAYNAGMPQDAIVSIRSTDRAETDELLGLRGLVDVLIPRGGAGLIQHCVDHARVPVIETGTGNCHIYIHQSADMNKALPIIINAKTQRTGVCNAAESLLIDEAIADEALPVVVGALSEAAVTIHGDEATRAVGLSLGIEVLEATVDDWGREYLDMDISIKVVSGIEEAIAHINEYGTHHSEAIIAENSAAQELFLCSIDAAAVYVNASTRFTDGGEFGLGAEIGISTQKLHARGPFALEALTTYKYLIHGNGQIRA